ncbi:MAG: hypothetical protein QOI10_4360 [Solirubrobacterales bacterium]|nr:hypothetical protein [Solirubrobacterales bacterium]
MSEVIVVIGAGSIGQAIARRVSSGKHVLLADLRKDNADAAAEVLTNAGFEVSTATVDVSSRDSVHALVLSHPRPLPRPHSHGPTVRLAEPLPRRAGAGERTTGRDPRTATDPAGGIPCGELRAQQRARTRRASRQLNNKISSAFCWCLRPTQGSEGLYLRARSPRARAATDGPPAEGTYRRAARLINGCGTWTLPSARRARSVWQ